MKQEHLGSEGGIGPANKRYRVLLPATARSLIVNIKEINDVVEEEGGRDLEVSSVAMEAYKLLGRAMNSS